MSIEIKYSIGINYPKINTLWMRDKKTHRIMEGQLSQEEFKEHLSWEATEKVDGQCIRIIWIPKPIENTSLGGVSFGCKTEGKEFIPKPLLAYLRMTFTEEKLRAVFPDCIAILFGEGYGKGIQNGGSYRSDVAFILFDAIVEADEESKKQYFNINWWWLEPENVKDIAQKLGIERVPSLGIYDMDSIIEKVKNHKVEPLISILAPGREMEGIVARAVPMMLTRKGEPIMFKLKIRDYQ